MQLGKKSMQASLMETIKADEVVNEITPKLAAVSIAATKPESEDQKR